MTQATPAQSAKSMLEEYAAEVSRAPLEAAPLPGAAPKRSGAADAGVNGANLELIMRIPVTVKVVLGSAIMPVANLTKLGRGAVHPAGVPAFNRPCDRRSPHRARALAPVHPGHAAARQSPHDRASCA